MGKYFLLLLLCLPQFISAFDATIPVLDLQEFHNPKTRNKFLSELETALREKGFFALTNPGIDPEILDQAYTASKEFFKQGFQEKMKINDPSNSGLRGYVLSESAKGAECKDFKELLHIGREECNPNLWPNSMELKEPMIALFNALDQGIMPLQEAFAALVRKPPDYFAKMTKEGNCLLRLTRYPANPPKGHIWAAEHTDIDLFTITILPQTTTKGLQIKNIEGNWVDVKVPSGALVINIGDMMENMSNGLFPSPVHRVVDGGRHEERFSMLFFVHARDHDDLSPLPYCIKKSGGTQKYANGTEFDMLCERLADLGLASTKMLKELGRSGFLEKQITVGRESIDAMRAVDKAGYAGPFVQKRLVQLDQEH